MEMRHLWKIPDEEGRRVWCGASGIHWTRGVSLISWVTCQHCLDAVVRHGQEAAARLSELDELP